VTTIQADRRAARGELVAYGVLVVLGVAVLVSSFTYDVFLEEKRIGPGFLPMLLGVLLVLLSGAALISSLRSSRAEPVSVLETLAGADDGTSDAAAAASAEGESGVDVLGRTPKERVKQMRIVVAATFVTLLLVPYAGFLLAFGALVLFIATVVERRSWLSALAITAVAVAVVYGVFAVFLNVPLPTGLFSSTSGG